MGRTFKFVSICVPALATIEGVGSALDPTFDFLGHVQPQLEELVKSRYRPEALRRRLTRAAGAYVDLVEELPADLRALARQVRRRDLEELSACYR